MENRNDRRDDGHPYECETSYLNWNSCSSLSSKARLFSSHSTAVGLIEHRISKMDTLAGIAIRYGVEVADIKKMNGLGTDLQMFALKTLRVPTPGRHPPSRCLSNGSDGSGEICAEKTTRRHSDLLNSFESLRIGPPPMNSLQSYYGLHQNGDCPSSSFPPTKPVNGDLDVLVGGPSDSERVDPDKASENLVRRRQKSEADFSGATVLDESTCCSGFSVIAGKGLALRPGRSSAVTGENEFGRVNPTSSGFDPPMAGVRRSSSTSSLNDSGGAATSSLLRASSRWTLKQELPPVTRPIFDGLPKPGSGRKNKAALD